MAKANKKFNAGPGVAMPAGVVGELKTATLADVAFTASNSNKNVGSIALTEGIWLIFGTIAHGAAGTTMTYASGAIVTGAETNPGPYSFARQLASNAIHQHPLVPRYVAVPAGGATYNIFLRLTYTGTDPSSTAANSYFAAIRLA